MSKIRNKENEKKLIIMIVIIMLFNFVMPNYSQAVERGFCGTIFKYVAPIILMVPDLIMEKLQSIFIADNTNKEELSIFIEDPLGGISYYSFLYSPAVIFSGRVAGLDVNFISPRGNNGKIISEYNYYEFDENPLEEGISYEELKSQYGLNEVVEGNSNSDFLTYLVWFRF